MVLDMEIYKAFGVYFTTTNDRLPINVLRFLPDDFYGGNHGVAVKGYYEYDTHFAKYAKNILDYLYNYIGYENLYFYSEDNRIHFGNKSIKLFTVKYADEFKNDSVLKDRLQELIILYSTKGFLDE